MNIARIASLLRELADAIEQKRRSQVQIQQSAPAVTRGGGEQQGNSGWNPAVAPRPGDQEPTFVYRDGWFGPEPPPAVEADFGFLREGWR